jgi:tetratricopeptide (TPR) repeat protein
MSPSIFTARATTLAVLAICGAAQKPTRSSTESTVSYPAKSGTKVQKPKLTERQQHALDLLQVAVAESSSLEPDMRSFVLWKAAKGFSLVDKRKTASLLTDAFRASQSVEETQADSETCDMDEVCHVRRFLQESILRDIALETPLEAEKLLPQAEPDVRQPIVSLLIDQYARKKDLEHGKSLLATAAAFERYPYSSATNLMLALPADSPDRLSIFMQAFNAFQEYSSKDAPVLTDDFGEMVVRFWRGLPPAAVVQAIDALLSTAKELDKHQRSRFSFSTQQGKSGSFASGYQLRLFQMLPILDELDKERADDLRKENRELQPLLAQYPRGLQSVDSSIGDKPQDRNLATGIFSSEYSTSDQPGETGDNGVGAARAQAQAEIRRGMEQVSKELSDNPQQALADAKNMPLRGAMEEWLSPRCSALMKVVQATAKKNANIAASALDEVRKNVEGLPLLQRGHFLTDAADSYLKIGQVDEAAKTLQEAMKVTEKLYARDADASDPNLAFKGVWPSTGLWWKCVQAGAAISSKLAEQLLAAIPDPEIAAYERVAYANSLLGRRESPELAEQHKTGGASVVSF